MDFTRLVQEMETILQICETPFESRIRHTHRVMKWAERLLYASELTVDADVVMCACIFHDIGYAVKDSKGLGHAQYSVSLLQERISMLPLTETQIQKVFHCIRYHSCKKWLINAPQELIPELMVLMEADLLDQCGPIALIRIAAVEGRLPDASFARLYERFQEAASLIVDNPCRSQKAREYWETLHQLHTRFIASYKRDLYLDLDPSWKAPYTDTLLYMQQQMQHCDLVPNRYGVIFPFRQRSLHMERVAAWAYRLSASFTTINHTYLMWIAFLHDIGYSVDPDGITHAYSGLPFIRDYLKKFSIPEEDMELLCRIVHEHSNKEYLLCDDNDLYFQLLLEADHMDETGAMSICWDIMASANADTSSFQNTADHIARFTLKMLKQSPMKTPEALRIWKEKQQLVYDFYNLLQWSLEELL